MAYRKACKRNVVVLGKAGCGKSTLASKIIHQDGAFKVASSFKVEGRNSNVKQDVEIHGQLYKINMIDTIGLKASRNENTKIVMREIKTQVKCMAPEGLNLMIFVLRNGRFTHEERIVFRKITDSYNDTINDISLLVITGCDGKSKRECDDIVENFRVNPLTKNVAAVMKKGIYCVGLPDINDLKEELKRSAIEKMTNDMIPICRVIAEADILYSHDQIQRGTCTACCCCCYFC